MDDLPARLAQFLEQVATKIRAMTVGRVEKAIRFTSLGVIAISLALMTVVFLALSAFGALEIPLTTAGAYGVVGGLFLVAGVFMWTKRDSQDRSS